MDNSGKNIHYLFEMKNIFDNLFACCQAATISRFAYANSTHDANAFSHVSLTTSFLLFSIEMKYR